MKANRKGFTLVELLVVIGILGILMGALFPAITAAMIKANLASCSMRGRNLYVAITSANVEREAAGLTSIWPRSGKAASSTGGEKDISEQSYSSAYQYFNDLFDVKNINDTDNWNPYVTGIDLGCLSGAGVQPVQAGSELKAENVGWAIAANVQDEIEDIVPVLVTRNVDCSSLRKKYDGGNEKMQWSAAYNTPFAKKAFVMINKGGGAVAMTGRYLTTAVIYKKQSFELPDETEDFGAFVYLGPDSTQNPR